MGRARGDFQRYGDGDLYDGQGPTLTAGVNWASGDLVYGGFVGYGRQSLDWGHAMGDFSQTDASLGGFLGWTGDNAWVNGQLSYSRLGFDTDRDVRLGPATRTHHGSTNGSNVSAGINAGWDFVSGGLRHGPVASILSQHIDVDGLPKATRCVHIAGVPGPALQFAHRKPWLAGQLSRQRSPAAVRATDLGS